MSVEEMGPIPQFEYQCKPSSLISPSVDHPECSKLRTLVIVHNSSSLALALWRQRGY